MLRNVLLAAVLCVVASFPAHADLVRSTLRGFGLLGIWAPDCGQPPSSTNEFATYSAPASGKATLVYRFSPNYPDRPFTIHGVERLTDNKLLLHEEDDSDHSFLDVTVLKTAKKLRVFSSQGANGKVYVADGKIAPSGFETQWFNRCGK